MKTILSHSKVRLYSECPRKYKFSYKDRLRSRNTHGALLFGSAIDHALNNLLENRNLEQAHKEFDKMFNYQSINNVPTVLSNATNIVYSLKDFDADLLTPEDIKQYQELKLELKEGVTVSVGDEYKTLQESKKINGFSNLSYNQKRLYNLLNWMALKRKGHIMVDSYYEKVLPKIKRVLAVQKKGVLVNDDKDELVYVLDLIVEWEDGKVYLMDHKTSSMEYEFDSAMRSQQLVLYYHAEKEEYKLDGVGFIVLMKNIMKNKVKICSKCGYDGSGSRHKTCSNEADGVRCNGEWTETISPKCYINVIRNEVPENCVDLVIETFDEANNGIKKGVFPPNLSACGNNESFRCDYFNKCWKGKDDDLIKLEEKK